MVMISLGVFDSVLLLLTGVATLLAPCRLVHFLEDGWMGWKIQCYLQLLLFVMMDDGEIFDREVFSVALASRRR